MALAAWQRWAALAAAVAAAACWRRKQRQKLATSLANDISGKQQQQRPRGEDARLSRFNSWQRHSSRREINIGVSENVIGKPASASSGSGSAAEK
jgi:hypothetical protein